MVVADMKRNTTQAEDVFCKLTLEGTEVLLSLLSLNTQLCVCTGYNVNIFITYFDF